MMMMTEHREEMMQMEMLTLAMPKLVSAGSPG
jgi:hypothetical protein